MLSTNSSPERDLVIALHCSGADARAWRKLGERLAPDFDLQVPEHYGCESTGHWTGAHAFTLADEAARTLALIDSTDRDIHLVGHSYGGGIALHVALQRSERIASLTLYEPSAFHLLTQFGQREARALAEVQAIAVATQDGLATGAYRSAAATFIDYWSGPGTWAQLRPALQAALVRWLPKAPLDFAALMNERTPAHAYGSLTMPVLILRGEHAPAPTRLIAERLRALVWDPNLVLVEGAGHMGPHTHQAEVNSMIAAHIDGARLRSRTPIVGVLPRLTAVRRSLMVAATAV